MQNQLADKLFQQKERALLKEKDAEAAKQEAVREFEALKAKREIEEGRHQTERAQAIMAATSSANNKLENQIVAYRRQGEQLDQQTRQTTALQLADKVPGLGSAFSDSTQQQRLNFSYLAAKVTYDRDKSIIPEADAAMHRALPPARLRTNALIAQGTISAGGSAYAISTNGIVSIYRLPDGKFWRSIDLQPWFGPTFSTPVTLNADSTRLWVSRDDRVVVLDIIDVSPKPVFDQQFDARRFLMFNPAATLLLAWTGPTGGQPAVWNIDSGTKVGTTLPYEGRIVFDGDGKRLFAVHLKSISVSESPFDSWKPIWKPLESAVKTFTVLKDGRVIILLEDRRLFRVSSDGSSAAELTKLEFPSDAVAVVLDAHWLEPRVRAMIVSVSARGEIKYKVKIFNLADEKHVEALDFPEFTGVPELFRDGRLAIPGQDGEITVWTAGAEQPKRLQVTTPPNFGVSLAKGNRVGGVSRDGLVTLLQPGVDKDQQGIWKDMGVKLPGRANTIRANTILLNPNGDRALIGYSDGSIWLGDPISGQTQYERRFGSELIEITIDESWANVAAAGDDGRIGVWELTHGESPRFVKAHAGRVRAIALSRDGALLASAAEDGIKIWKTANFGSESPRKSLQASGPTNALVFAGSEVIAGAEDGSITEWNVTTGYKRELVRAQKPTLEVFALAVDPDGKRLASGGADRILRVYDLKTGSELTKIAVYDGAIRRIAFDPSGLNVAAITDSGMIRVDPISSVDLMDTIGKLITKPFTRDECIKNAPLVASVCPVPAK